MSSFVVISAHFRKPAAQNWPPQGRSGVLFTMSKSRVKKHGIPARKVF
jgi:hypothetical protein